MIVKLNQSAQVDGLTPDQPYVVTGIEADDFRMLNDEGRPYLYAASDFVVVSADEPNEWIVEHGEDGERYAYPLELNQVGFFEDFFDGKQAQIASFWKTINKQLALQTAG